VPKGNCPLKKPIERGGGDGGRAQLALKKPVEADGVVAESNCPSKSLLSVGGAAAIISGGAPA